ncbi:MAG TPA: SCP2 sterol-binding domain-containing protein [Acidimicrobiales bacterium]|nr:SCP2 sterol-binding domain-containing protein [Acidimicrobiales bacterium]
MRYLSTAWMDAARRALAGDTGLQQATAEVELTVEHVVTAGPDGPVVWHLRFDHGSVALTPGPAEAPDLRLTTDRVTASAVAAGALGAQRAFAEGRLRLGGDLRVLTRHQRALATLDDVLAGVRAETTFDTGPGDAATGPADRGAAPGGAGHPAVTP